MIQPWSQESSLILLLVLHLGLALPVQDVSDQGMPLQLTVSPPFVSRYTAQNMTLRCDRNPDVQTEMAEVSRIRILKQSTSGWDLVAEKRDIVSSPTVSGTALASAIITGDISNVFLQVIWDKVDDDNFGVFKCYAMGFDVIANPVTESSTEVDIHEFHNVIGHVVDISNKAHRTMGDLKNSTVDEISQLKKTLNKVSTFLDSLILWPGGYYGLLKPKTGCPVDLAFFGGNRKFHKIHSESQSSSDPSNSHSSVFPDDTISSEGRNKFFTMEFCEVTRQFNPSSWPQGSFCIHKLLHQSCPAGFDEGYVNVDAEDTDNAGEARNNVALGASNPRLYFCCQNSGSASDSIQLPTGSAFLLYRFGGECQSVQGMSVSEEFIQINSEDSSNYDLVSGSHPDVNRPGSVIKFYLCYYK
ncbi:hypothetical protein RRG08_037582 [Elysia crispata]|uniref:Apextrin C-terminal domain-containing protein n=1 Tax=Elysia crispata TaxID=231223 RepID=A0AAE1DSX9_9GAST|nr:hypothetical protein RRG08_037582 [Elysia crispata]